jgi:carboxylesterase
LPAIKVPALVIQGRHDSMVSPENADLIYRALGSKDKHLLYLDRSDHVVTMDFDKQIVFEKVFSFIHSGGLDIN